jgi:hypothetical protein
VKKVSAITARTIIEALSWSFASSLRVPDGVLDPVVLLWTDADAQWKPLVAILKVAQPQIFVLGTYAPEERQGPAIWLRCVVDRTLPEVALEQGVVPILYLPNVSRQQLRAAGDCPPDFKPLIELQYRGRVWHQRNGRDWSVEAFMVSEEGLGLDVAQDARTREAMIRALPLLADAPLDSLRGRRLEADDFDRLAVSDPVRDLLRWMSDPTSFEKASDGARWQSFRNLCRNEFGIDPELDGYTVAGNALAYGKGRWNDVWHRFNESPGLYPGISKLLRDVAASRGKLAFDLERNPIANDEAEAQLRLDLEAAAHLPHFDACARVQALEAENKKRRELVWARLGESPLAFALEPLGKLADLAQSPIGGATVEEAAAAYAERGYLCDRVLLQALAIIAKQSTATVIHKVVRALYEPWADASARHFQSLVAQKDGDLRDQVTGIQAEKETCIVFADGLRFDIGAMLQEELEARGLHAGLTHRIAPLPTVTATAKPIVMPAHEAIEGAGGIDDFTPLLAESRQPAIASRLRDEMARRGVEVFDEDETGTAARELGGWTEIGKLDELGHSLDSRLAQHVEDEMDRIADRIVELLESGWKRVRVVTDHGWLLLPGGLPKVELPAYLASTKWSRCATAKSETTLNVPTYAWHWHPHTRIASPPGIACFRVGYEYAHGGVSLQECVTPELVIERSGAAITASIGEIQWRGMRCRIRVRTTAPSVRVDLRLNWRQELTSVVASVKEVGATGEVSLVVADDSHEGSAATVVLLDPAGNVLDWKPTTVGETL